MLSLWVDIYRTFEGQFQKYALGVSDSVILKNMH